MGKHGWIAHAYFTTVIAGNELPTDDVPGAAKTMKVSVDYQQAVANGMNVGLDSWLDVRLAVLAFGNVYMDEGQNLLEQAASLVLSALQANPHHIEAWDLLFAHISMTTITSDSLLARAYSISKAVARSYVKTFEMMLKAISNVYECSSSGTGPLGFLLGETADVAGTCATALSVNLKASILPCLRTSYVGLGAMTAVHELQPYTSTHC